MLDKNNKATDDQATDKPVEETKAEESKVEETVVKEPKAEKPETEEPVTEEPKVEETVTEEPASSEAGPVGTDQQGRQLYDATCASCGKKTQVPFKPVEGRPVYCRDCYIKQRRG